ncbi:MAG: hypothetical protein Ct9H300mP23_02660 [Nitrospinota bacterium]|nr:MAG: hypothetical protein Ct9H300mP23_02660 [Nitrospinota bacterium]
MATLNVGKAHYLKGRLANISGFGIKFETHSFKNSFSNVHDRLKKFCKS